MKYNYTAAIAPNEEPTTDDNQGGITPPSTEQPENEPLQTEGGYKALQAEREQRKALERQIKALEAKYGNLDPTELDSLRQFKTEAEQKAAEQRQRELEEKQQYEAAKAKLVEEFTAKVQTAEQSAQEQIAALTNEKQALASQYENLLISTALNDAFLKAGGDPQCLELLDIPKIRGRLSIVDGAIAVQGTDDPIDKWIESEVKTGYARLFKPEGTASGGGTSPGSGASNGTNPGGISAEDFAKLKPYELAERGRR